MSYVRGVFISKVAISSFNIPINKAIQRKLPFIILFAGFKVLVCTNQRLQEPSLTQKAHLTILLSRLGALAKRRLEYFFVSGSYPCYCGGEPMLYSTAIGTKCCRVKVLPRSLWSLVVNSLVQTVETERRRPTLTVWLGCPGALETAYRSAW